MPLGDLLTGSRVMNELRKWNKISKYSEEKIQELAYTKLLKLLNFATQYVPFYAQFSNSKANNPYEWIKNFPIMYKRDVKQHLNTLTSVPNERLILELTGGSSGVRGLALKSKHDISRERALILLIWSWAGYYPGKPILQTGMSLKRGFIKLIKDFLLRTKYYNAFNLNESDIRSLLQEQVGKKKFHLAGYASSLYVIADTYLRLGMTDVKFDKAISLASKMFPHYRKRIKEAFGCDVIDTYGLSEGLFIGAQKDIEYYYILSPHVFIEILDEQGNEVKDGELGYVVATSLDAYAMPFIRYYTGDMAVKLPKSRYPANREMNFPLLEKIIGRDTDFVRTRSGKILVVEYFSAICEFFPEIYQFKVIQRNLDEIEIEYIPDEKFSEETLKSIGHQIHDYLKEDFPIIWRKVDVILPTPSGKPQIIQSFLKNEQLKN
jgi:phenylacetate-CoA ligase